MKRFSPHVLDAIVEALRTAYWYKDDLRSFLLHAGVPSPRIAALSWGPGTYKRTIARQLVGDLAAEPSTGMPVLQNLVDSRVELDGEFKHLSRRGQGQ